MTRTNRLIIDYFFEGRLVFGYSGLDSALKQDS